MNYSARVDCDRCGVFDLFIFEDYYDVIDMEVWVMEHECEGGRPVSLVPHDGPHLAIALDEPVVLEIEE